MGKKRAGGKKKQPRPCYVVTLTVTVADKESAMRHAAKRLALMGEAMLDRREALDYHVGAAHLPHPPSDTIAS